MNKIAPSPSEILSRLRAEIRIGLMLNTDQGAFAAIETLSEARLQALQDQGEVQVILSRQRALDLQLSYDPSRAAVLSLPKDYPYGKLKALADPAMDLDYPGKGPLAQAALPKDYCDKVLQFCRQSRLLPAVVFVPYQVEEASTFTKETWSLVTNQAPRLEKLSHARVPLELAPQSQLQVFRELNFDNEHYAIIIGGALNEAPLVRLHSACFTGDCLGSLKCDCGPQLHRALKSIQAEGGILLYLSQEGRGIGLPNKIRAYHLQDQGLDTVEANLKLGFKDDERDFRIGAEILKHLKVQKVRLMTNNPRKIEWLNAAGIEVIDRVPIQIPPRQENRAYLETKAKKSGHIL